MNTKYSTGQYAGCMDINKKVRRDVRHQQEYYREDLVTSVKKAHFREKTFSLKFLLTAIIFISSKRQPAT